MEQTYRIGVNIPCGFEQDFMNSVNEAVSPLYPGYDRCFCWWTVNGTWRPLEGASPFQGTVGEIEETKETRIEFSVRKEDLESAISAISKIHPYEEPAIDIIPTIAWKSVVSSEKD